MRSKNPNGITVRNLLDFIEQANVDPDTLIHVSVVSQHDYEGDWRRGGAVVELANYDSFLSLRDACHVCG